VPAISNTWRSFGFRCGRRQPIDLPIALHVGWGDPLTSLFGAAAAREAASSPKAPLGKKTDHFARKKSASGLFNERAGGIIPLTTGRSAVASKICQPSRVVSSQVLSNQRGLYRLPQRWI
jgi:hypothetical protein